MIYMGLSRIGSKVRSSGVNNQRPIQRTCRNGRVRNGRVYRHRTGQNGVGGSDAVHRIFKRNMYKQSPNISSLAKGSQTIYTPAGVLEYNYEKCCADWVCEKLTRKNLNTDFFPEKEEFFGDPKIPPQFRIDPSKKKYEYLLSSRELMVKEKKRFKKKRFDEEKSKIERFNSERWQREQNRSTFGIIRAKWDAFMGREPTSTSDFLLSMKKASLELDSLEKESLKNLSSHVQLISPEHQRTQEAYQATFNTANTVPQNITLKEGVWFWLEKEVRDLTKVFDSVHVFTGPLYDENPKVDGLGLAVDKHVPSSFFKVILVEGATGDKHMGAFWIHNRAVSLNAPLTRFVQKVRTVEQAAGLIFFPGMPGVEDIHQENDDQPYLLFEHGNFHRNLLHGMGYK